MTDPHPPKKARANFRDGYTEALVSVGIALFWGAAVIVSLVMIARVLLAAVF